jgi:two-component system, OmpR family, sensor histidine kinase MtrB
VRLRTILTAVMSGIGVIAVCVTLALVQLTSSLYQAGLNLSSSTERVRLLMELEALALEQVRSASPADSQRSLDVVERLQETAGGDSDRLDALIMSLEALIRSLEAAPTPAAREATFDELAGTLRRIVAVEDERAGRALAAATAANRLATGAGLAAVIVLLAGVAAALAWLWRSALQPLVTLADDIGHVARGDVQTHVSEAGPSEIRQVAVAFNDVVSSVRQSRERQLAFLGGVAHDLRNPLSALQLAAAGMNSCAPDQVRTRERIRRQIDRMDRMLGDLLDRTRIEAGRVELNRQPCELRELVGRVVEVYQEMAPDRTFRLLLPQERLDVWCDPLRIEQVVTNLLSNAVKYSPRSADIHIVLEREAAAVRLSVWDHGIGIAEADLDRLFEPFRRGANVGEVAGSGLGLSVSRKIVEAHGGRIDVNSELDAGSVFSVWLPAAGDAERQPGPVRPLSGPVAIHAP